MYSNSIYDIGSQYDFNEMQGFSTYLRIFKRRHRHIISACNFKLTDVKTKKEQAMLNSISKAENQELIALKLEIARIRQSFAANIERGSTKAQKEVEREKMRK